MRLALTGWEAARWPRDLARSDSSSPLCSCCDMPCEGAARHVGPLTISPLMHMYT